MPVGIEEIPNLQKLILNRQIRPVFKEDCEGGTFSIFALKFYPTLIILDHFFHHIEPHPGSPNILR